MTVQGNVYLRYLSFLSAEQLKSELIKKLPNKIDIGAVYTTVPQIGHENHPQKKELVFDIDLTDYDRKCCSGKDICDLCFTLIKCSAKIMDFILRNNFGFKHILYVFSGGRGMHIWVCDEEAILLDDKERKGLADYINNGGKLRQKQISNTKKYLNHKTGNESIKDDEILEILKSFDYYFEDQKLEIEITEKSLYEHLYVRLDENVTSSAKHLLKSPFSVHPSTGNVSVSLSIEMLQNIKLSELPSLEDIILDDECFIPFVKVFRDFNASKNMQNK